MTTNTKIYVGGAAALMLLIIIGILAFFLYKCNTKYDDSARKVDVQKFINKQNSVEKQFDEKQSTSLCEIMGRHGSDKGHKNITNSWHNYTTLYYYIFKNLREAKLRLFELGLGTNNVKISSNMGANGTSGASLHGWAEFFPNSDIFGADIDKEILFNTNRIKTFYCDQTNRHIIKNMWNEPDLSENFNIIIEDGLHTFEANVCFFENSIHKVKPNGYFIIEDISNNNSEKFINKIKKWERQYKDCSFALLQIPSSCNHSDNRLLLVFKRGV